jgi:Domain of unknown function (DUF4190)
MRRCPNCNRTFEEDWLSFCTDDGTTLIEDEAAPAELAATTMAPPRPESHNANEQATWNLANSGARSPAAEVKEAAWRPPPPPIHAQPENKTLATASMIVGILSMACLGPLPAIVAIVLGAVALSQIKKNPGRVGGRQSALVGIVTGSLGLVVYGGLIIFYIVLLIMGSTAR